MAKKGDVMTMRPVSGGLSIEPGRFVALVPGGYHLMIMGLKAPLKEGQAVPITPQFEKAGRSLWGSTSEALVQQVQAPRQSNTPCPDAKPIRWLRITDVIVSEFRPA